MQYNGGSVIAMVGKDCVAIASDMRLGVQSLGISSNFQKVRERILLGSGDLDLGVTIDILSYGSDIYWLTRPCNRCHNTVCFTLSLVYFCA